MIINSSLLTLSYVILVGAINISGTTPTNDRYIYSLGFVIVKPALYNQDK